MLGYDLPWCSEAVHVWCIQEMSNITEGVILQVGSNNIDNACHSYYSGSHTPCPSGLAGANWRYFICAEILHSPNFKTVL